jgi:hypothetical protein
VCFCACSHSEISRPSSPPPHARCGSSISWGATQFSYHPGRWSKLNSKSSRVSNASRRLPTRSPSPISSVGLLSKRNPSQPSSPATPISWTEMPYSPPQKPAAAAVSDPITLPHQQYPVVDWLNDHSPQMLGSMERTCEMACYLSSPSSHASTSMQFRT